MPLFIYAYNTPHFTIPPITPPTSCGTSVHVITLYNPSDGDPAAVPTSFFIECDTRLGVSHTISTTLTGAFTTVPGGTLFTPTPAIPPMPPGSSLVNIFTVTYNTSCLVLPQGPLPDLTFYLKTKITVNYTSSIPGPHTYTDERKSYYDYANLYIGPGSVLTSYSDMGNIATRTINLNSAGTAPSGVATDFIGYISITDRDATCSSFYQIESVKIYSVDIISSVRTLISSSAFPLTPPSISPGPLPIYTSGLITFIRTDAYLQIEEVVRLMTSDPLHCIDDCPDDGRISSDIDIKYGCEDPTVSPFPDLCNTISTKAYIYKGDFVPKLEESIAPYTNSCFKDPIFIPASAPPITDYVLHTSTITNNGGANAYNVKLNLTTGNIRSTEIITPRYVSISGPLTAGISSPTYTYYNDGLTLDEIAYELPSCVHSFKEIDNVSGTDVDEPLSKVDWTIDILKPGESITISYRTYRCCPSDTNRIVGNFRTPEYIDVWRVRAKASDFPFVGEDECGGQITLLEVANNGPALAHIELPRTIGPTNLTGTATSCTPSDDSRYLYNLPISKFCGDALPMANELLLMTTPAGYVDGKLRITIITQSGLNPTPASSTSIYLKSLISGAIIYPSSSSGIPYSAITGCRYDFVFDLDDLHEPLDLPTYANLKKFLEQSYFAFYINPCCPGEATPYFWTQWSLLPRSTDCGDCWIPIGQTVTKIQLHCPGCVIPGIIADNCKVERLNAGYLDRDNLGIANAPVLPFPERPYESVTAFIAAGGYPFAAHTFMQGDSIGLHFDARAQDGDDADEGVSYATLMSEWNSHTIGYPSPAAFTDLNIEIFNPCAAASQFNWIPYLAELKVIRGSGVGSVTTISLLSSYIVSTGSSYFYRIPASVTGPFIINAFDPNNDKYDITIKYRVCGNGSASDCDITTRMWWSGVSTHGPSTWGSVALAKEVNGAYVDPIIPPPSEAYDRAQYLVPNLIYLCEAHGDRITGFNIKEEYQSHWENHNSEDFPSSNTCNKVLTNSYSIRACDIDPTINNVFAYEYRPLVPNMLTDHFVTPPSSPSPGYTYFAAGSSTFSNYRVWRPFVNANILNGASGLIPSSLLPGTLNTIGLTGSYDILTDATYPPTTINKYIAGDERTNVSINYDFVPSPLLCVTRGETTSITNFDNEIQSERSFCSTISNTIEDDPETFTLRSPKAIIRVTPVNAPVTVYSMTETCFDILVRNTSTSGEIAENIILHIPSPSTGGSINTVSLISGPSDVTCTGGPGDWVINHLNSGQTVKIRICFVLNSCDPHSSIQITYNYGCTPVLLPCNPDKICNVTLKPADVTLIGKLITPTASVTTVHPCTPQEVESQFYITDLGEVNSLTFTLTLPVGTNLLSSEFTICDLLGSPCPLGPIYPDIGSPITMSGFQTWTYTMSSTTILTLLPVNNQALIKFKIIFGSCVSGIIRPVINLSALTYCNSTISANGNPAGNRFNVTPDATCPVLGLSASVTKPFCRGSMNGAINLTVSGGTAPFSYRWSNGAISEDLSALDPGIYTVIVTDDFGCSITANYEVVALTNPIHLPTITEKTYTTCDEFGIVKFSAYIPIPNHLYTWVATNTLTGGGYFSSGSVPSTGPWPSTISLHFADPNLGSMVTIRATDNSDPSNPHPCFDEVKVWIEPCCDKGTDDSPSIPYPMISNTTASTYFGISGAGLYTEMYTSFRVNGVFTIDHDIKFLGVHLYMEPFSQIVINPGINAQFDKTTVVACDTTMWKGINVPSTATVWVTGSHIYDALAAITTTGNGQFTIEQNSYFNRNYVDIDVKPLLTSNSTSSIIQSSMFCHPESFELFGKHSNPGRLWFPHKDSITFVGINVVDNQSLTIGLLNVYLAPPNTNYFSDMNFGIYSSNSAMNINNNNFDHMVQFPGYINPFPTPPTPAAAGDGIYFAGTSNPPTYVKSIDAERNRFTNIPHAAMYLLGSEVQGTIKYNTMGTSISNTCGFGILSNLLGTLLPPAAPHKILNVWGNTIYYSSGGIRLENNNRIKALITNTNEIFGPVGGSVPIPTTIGIYISTLTLNSTNAPWFSISYNNIHEGKGGIGIVSSTAPTSSVPLPYTNQIIQNNIYNSEATRVNYIGIGIQNSNNVLVSCNSITGNVAYLTAPSKTNQGIYLNNAKENVVTCNSIDYMNKAFSYFMNCSMIDKMASNKFNRNNYHIYCSGDPTNVIGNQSKFTVSGTNYFQANEMIDIHSYAPGYSIYNGGVAYSFTRKTTSLIFDPNTQGNLFGVTLAAPVPLTLANYTGCTITCNPSPPGEGSGTSGPSGLMMEREKFALDLNETTEMAYGSEEEGVKKLSEELLYDMLKSDTALMGNDTLQEFYDDKKEEHTGKLDEIKDLISNNEFTDADTKLSALPLSNDAEETNKTLYEIVNNVQQRKTYTLTEEELNTLIDIAGLCPIKYGQAVYSARVLINTQYGYETMGWEDEELCTSGISYRRSKVNINSPTDSLANNDFMIFPNPASTELHFKINNSSNCVEGVNTKLEILDVLGNTVIKRELDGFISFGELNISILANGVYIIRYSCGTNEIYHQSFVINK